MIEKEQSAGCNKSTVSPVFGLMGSKQTRFEALVHALSADLFRYAVWLCRDRSQAEDLVQETFLRAWRSLDTLRDERAAKGWLITILRREHARQYERHVPIRDYEVDPDDLPGTGDNTSAEAAALRVAVAHLSEEYRVPLLLQNLGGYSCEEIAQFLGLSSGAVMTRLFRARRKLRAVLDGDENAANRELRI